MNKLLISSIVFLLITCGWGASSVAQEAPAPRGEIRIVDNHPNTWPWITLNVFEHLIAADKDGKMVPRLATSWRWLDDRTLEFSLRQGVTFHNGEVFDAEIVKLNWEENTRVKQPFGTGTYMSFKPGSRLEIIDPQTVRFIFPEPDGGALARIFMLHIGNRQFHREHGWGEKDY